MITPSGVHSAEIDVPVRGLSSGESGLDSNARNALDADKFPEIRFQLDSYQLSGGQNVHVKGRLRIAAVEKPIELDAIAVKDGTALHLTGQKQLLMTDYGIKAPKFMMGMMSVSDPVVVHFDLQLAPTS